MDADKICYVCHKPVSYPGYYSQDDLGLFVCMACIVGIGFEHNEPLTINEILDMIVADYLKTKEANQIKTEG